MSTSPGSAGSPTEDENAGETTVEIAGEGPVENADENADENGADQAAVVAEPAVAEPVVMESAPPRRRASWWVAAVTFGAGVVVGILVVGLLSAGTPGFVSQARSEQNTPAPGDPSGSVQVAVEAQVNAACLRVINEAQDVYGALTGLDEAVDQVDFQQLDDIARRLQPIEPRLARDLSDCEVRVNSGSDPSATGSATPVVPRPSASPTG